MKSMRSDRISSPSSLSDGNSKQRKYNMIYPVQRGTGYIFDYSLKQRWNYLFNYLVFPKYARHTFIYDITESILIESPQILLDRSENGVFNENIDNHYYRLNKKEKKIETKDINMNLRRDNIYSIIYDSVMHDLNNVDRTLVDFIEYARMENANSKKRNITLFSGEYPKINRNYIHSSVIEESTIYDFNIENAMDRLIDIFEVDVLISSNPSFNSIDVESITKNLKKDYRLKKIIEDMYISKIGVSPIKQKKQMFVDSSRIKADKDYKLIEHNIENVVELEKKSYEVNVEDTAPFLTKNSMLLNNEKQYPSMYDDIADIQKEDATNFEIVNKLKNVINDYLNESSDVLLTSCLETELKEEEETRIQPLRVLNLDVEKHDDSYFLEKIPNDDFKKNDDSYYLDKSIKENDSFRVDESVSQLQSIVNESTTIKFVEEIININNETKDNIGLDVQPKEDIFFERTDSRNASNNNMDDLSIKRTDSRNIDNTHINPLENVGGANISSEEDIQELDKFATKTITLDGKDMLLNDVIKKLEVDFEKQLDLHKRFWFVKSFGKIDYKILPNTDFSYPADINIFVEKPDFIYEFSFDVEYQDILSDSFNIELYDYNYKKVDSLHVNKIATGTYSNDKIKLKIESQDNIAEFDLKIKHDNLYYIIIRQPLDINGYPVLYTVTKKFLGENKHPIPFGEDLGTNEIAIHLNVMVDFINILMLIWSKFYYQFTGYTGVHAIYGIVNVIHEWLTLDTSIDADNIEEYHRCFRWLRWEAEKLYNIARNDVELTGNAWIEELIYQLVEYMEMHHVNDLPEFNPIHLMDEYRNIFEDPSFDIDIVVDKVKGIRKRAIDTNKNSRNKK